MHKPQTKNFLYGQCDYVVHNRQKLKRKGFPLNTVHLFGIRVVFLETTMLSEFKSAANATNAEGGNHSMGERESKLTKIGKSPRICKKR